MKTSRSSARLFPLVSGILLSVGLCGCAANDSWRKPFEQAQKNLASKQYAQAEAKLQDALRAVQGAADKDNLAVQQALGDVLFKENKLAQAEPQLQSTLDFVARKFGDKSVEAMPTLGLLSEVCYRTKRFDKAENYARQALAAGEAAWGKDDVRLEQPISTVVGTACINGTCKDEMELYQRLLNLREKLFGKDDLRTCAARQMLSESLMHKKRYADCMDLYKYNLTVYSRKNTLFVPGTLNHIASVYEAQGKPAQAAATWQQAISIERSSPVLSGALTVSLQSLAHHYEELGQLKDAEKTYKEALDTVVAQAGSDNPAAADYLISYARVLKKEGKLAAAQKYQAQADKLQDLADSFKRKEISERKKG